MLHTAHHTHTDASPPHTGSPAAHGRRRKLSADEINAHPVATYEGPIHVIDHEVQVEPALRGLRQETLLGFDTETRPTFRKGEYYPPALLQLAGERDVWIFKLGPLGLPSGVAQVLADPGIIKAGVSNARDVSELRRLHEFQPAAFVDLGHAAKHAGVPHHGLRGLAAVFLGCRISKSAQLTNWARADLPTRALQYAATDAWVGRRLYAAMVDAGCIHPPAPAARPRPAPSGLRLRLRALLARFRK